MRASVTVKWFTSIGDIQITSIIAFIEHNLSNIL